MTRSRSDIALPYHAHLEYEHNWCYDTGDTGTYTIKNTSAFPKQHGAVDDVGNRIRDTADYFRTRKCQYCATAVHQSTEASHTTKELIEDYAVINCPACGWWIVKGRRTHVLETMPEMDFSPAEYYLASKDTFFEGIVYKFDIGNTAESLRALRHAVVRGKKDLRHMAPRTLELLVGSVFRDFFDCQVRHIGGPGDGGIDLLLISGDCPTVVQVKRRTTGQQKEGVQVVRELLGTMLLEDVNKGIIVSTATDFSPPAKLAARIATERRGVRVSLFNQDRLRDTLCLTEPQEKPWLSVNAVREGIEHLTPQSS